MNRDITIEVTMTPNKYTNTTTPFFWAVFKTFDGNQVLIKHGDAETPSKAWKEANQYLLLLKTKAIERKKKRIAQECVDVLL